MAKRPNRRKAVKVIREQGFRVSVQKKTIYAGFGEELTVEVQQLRKQGFVVQLEIR